MGSRARMLASSALLASAACLPSFDGLSGGGDEDASLPGRDAGADVLVDDSGNPVDSGGDAGPALPASCAEARDRGVRTNDGDVLVDPDRGGSLQPFTVYCKDLASAPKEYLSLVNLTDPNAANAGGGSNVTGWSMGPGSGATSCLCPPDVVRAYTKVRLTFSASVVKIDISDKTFSSTNRAGDQPNACEQAKSSCQAFGAIPSSYGVGASCMEFSATLGRGNVDLRGTPFHIAPSEAGHREGFQPVGSTTYTNDAQGRRKQAEVLGGGACGYGFPGKGTTTLELEQD